ncbi:ATP-binding protein [Actinokineospora sp. NBRC 105648]|uniref:ATP-binding protein n=1 Tax=Actinokineospora sp. NBRC 105648 TaxID=3032206 RepID=UPI0024A40731|nr:ATP-binding protein [Actinokineospora sp. NBRC 105648]GLZ40121.1 sensor protein CutS [Actinokineospora sp. NBRC 105648]
MRLRLTLLYGGLCLASCLVLLGVVFLLSGHSLAGSVEVVIRDAISGERRTNVTVVPKQNVRDGAQGAPLTPAQITRLAEQIQDDALAQLVAASAVAVGVMVLFASVVGWWAAGRVLRPLHTITSQARGMSARNIHERIALAGPPDELRDLADTFDGMLDRLDRAFTSQRRFVANASHELRTPLAIERAIIQVRLSSAGPEDIDAVREELLAANRRLDRLLEGLLLLARSDNGLPERHPVDIAQVASRVVAEALAVPPPGTAAGVRGSVEAAELVVLGDEVLLTQLVDNLVRNAMLYNVAGGWFRVEVAADAADAAATVVVVVSNSGPVVAEDTVDSLFEPFHRGSADRLATRTGAGLGLAIVRSIVEAHDGTATATARPDGGLEVAVTLPATGRPRTGR